MRTSVKLFSRDDSKTLYPDHSITTKVKDLVGNRKNWQKNILDLGI